MQIAKRKLAPIKNVDRINNAYANLAEGGMGLIYGHPGFGKTWASCAIYVREQGILVTARPGWTQKALLKSLLKSLGKPEIKGNSSNADLMDLAVTALQQAQDESRVRPIFVDEGDHLFGDRRCFETLRVLHDEAQVPLLVIGMSGVLGETGIDAKVKRYPQFADRIAEWVEFMPLDHDDLRLVAQYCCSGIQISDDLLNKLFDESNGNLRQARLGLARIERLAKTNRVGAIDLAQWGKKDFFLRKGA